MTAIAGILIAAFGAVNCFFGYHYQRLILGLWGVIFGAGLALSLTSQAAPIVVLIAALIGAVIGPLLILFAFRVGLFLIGAGAGFVLGAGVMLTLNYPESTLPAGLIGGVIFGLLALFLRRPIVIVLTALLGASAIVTGARMFLYGEDLVTLYTTRQFDLVQQPTTDYEHRLAAAGR